MPIACTGLQHTQTVENANKYDDDATFNKIVRMYLQASEESQRILNNPAQQQKIPLNKEQFNGIQKSGREPV